MENTLSSNKKEWLGLTLTLISTNDVNSKHIAAHHEKSVLPHPYISTQGGHYYQANGAGPLIPQASAKSLIS